MNMTNDFSYELQYAGLLTQIMDYGSMQKNERTEISTKRKAHGFFQINEPIASCTPLLIGKKVMWKSAIEEILWIMQKGSNNIHDLRPHIWDEWADPDGSIGKAYGYQVREYHQVEKVLDRLKKDSSDRRAVINLWNPADLDEMNLVPCCFASTWTIVDNKLYCLLTQRSADMALGVPFNTFQYYALMMMFAKHLGVGIGGLLHTMADAHVYENHFDGIRQYLNRVNVMREILKKDGQVDDFLLNMEFCPALTKKTNLFHIEVKDEAEFINLQYTIKKFLEVNPALDIPELRLETDKTNFWDFTIDDFVLEGYRTLPAIKFDVAV